MPTKAQREERFRAYCKQSDEVEKGFPVRHPKAQRVSISFVRRNLWRIDFTENASPVTEYVRF